MHRPNITINTNKESVHNINKMTDAKTDYMPQYFANSDKLIPEDKRKFYEDLDQDCNVDDIIKPEKNEKTEQKKHTDDSQSKNDDTEQNYYHGGENESSDNKMSKEEIMLEKLKYLRLLAELQGLGIKISQNYNLNSDLEQMKNEYNLHREIRLKRNSVNLMKDGYLTIIKSLETLNASYDPFNLDLDGWSEIVASDTSDYCEVFGEIYEKYNKPGRGFAPELRLLLLMTGSAMSVQIAKSISGGGPKNIEKMLDNPEVLESLRKKSHNNVNDPSIRKQDPYEDKIQQYHNEAAQKAEDLQMIRDKQIEHEIIMRRENEKRMELQHLKENILESQSLNSRSPPMSSTLQNIVNNNQSQQMDKYNAQQMQMQMMHNRMEQLEAQNRYLQQMNESMMNKSNKSTRSTKSQKSQVTINKNVDEVFKKSTKSKKKDDQVIQNILDNNMISASSNDNIIPLDTCDKDDMSFVTLGRKKKST
jgi:hypothetical protein